MQKYPLAKLHARYSWKNSQLGKTYWYAITLNPKGKLVSRETLIARFHAITGTKNILYLATIIEAHPKHHMHGIILARYPLQGKRTKCNIKFTGLTIHLKKLSNIYDWQKYCFKMNPYYIYTYGVRNSQVTNLYDYTFSKTYHWEPIHIWEALMPNPRFHWT